MGSNVPIHAAAIGKAVAAHLDPSHLSRILPPEPYPQLGPRSVTNWQELLSHLEDVRDRGYALYIEEVAQESHALPRLLGQVSGSLGRSLFPAPGQE